jgi:hypothetical protein
MTKTNEWLLEWGSTAILIIGVSLTAFNIFPLNVYLSLIGNFGWFLLAVYWKKWSLVTVQLIVTTIYVLGLIKLFVN